MHSIFVLGSLNTDLVIKTPYMPEAGETLTGLGFLTTFGGKGANQAAAAARLGGHVTMAGCVGDDSFGGGMIANLAAFGVRTSPVRTVADTSSGVAVITVCDGNNRIILHPGANACVTEADVDLLLAEAVADDLFLVQAEIPTEIILYALKAAKTRGMRTVFNPAPAKKELTVCFPYTDILTPNETELAILTDGATPEEAAGRLGIQSLVVTLGGDGWYANEGGVERRGACPKVKVLDTTAAGDTFCGAMVVRLARGDFLFDALPYASACASLACTKLGAQPSIPSLEEVEAFLASM